MNVLNTHRNIRFWRRDSVIARMSFLVIGVGLLTLLMHLLALWFVGGSLVRDAIEGLGSAVRHERMLLQMTKPSDRVEFARNLSRVGHTVAIDSNSSTGERLPPFAEMDDSPDRLRHAVGSDVRVSVNPGFNFIHGDQLNFRFTVDGQPWKISHRVTSPLLVALTTLLGWPIAIALCVTLSLLFGVRWVTRPMSELIKQLNERHETLTPLELPKSSSYEIRELVTAFNALVTSNLQAVQFKQQLLAGVSHDLRTPLTRLRMRVETECEPSTAENLVLDLKAVDSIVTQFLGYVQSESDASMGENWQLAEVMRYVVESYASQGVTITQSNSLQVVDYMQPDLAVQRALTNLIDNALVYGKQPLEVALTEESDEGNQHVVLTVWDHGKGMSAAEFERVKQPFVRLDTGLAADGHCGLGLAIVSQMADKTQATLKLRWHLDGRFGIALMWRLSV
jgi:two-component system, OmpR family, osmolarity sensor histidine kinase EnvZ